MEFNSLAQLKKFVINFGEMMSVEHGSHFIASDTLIDIDIINEWAKTLKKFKCSFPLFIYYRGNGTFTDWNRCVEVKNDLEYWAKESLGKMILNYDPMTKKYSAEFSKTW